MIDKNSRISEDLYKGQGALRVDDLDGANATIITVEDVDSMEFDDEDAPGGSRTVLILKSEEYEKGFFLNKSGLRTIVEQYGDVPAKWIGKRIPLVVVRTQNPKLKKTVQSLQVASADEWDKITGQTRRNVTARKATRGKKTARRGRK